MKPRNPDAVLTTEEVGLALTGESLKELMQAVLRKNTPFRFRAGGCSMAPFIKDGDILTVYPPPAASPGIGDVAAFSHPVSGRLTVHRVVAQANALYRMRGDGLDAADGNILQENIIGVVRKVERNGRTVIFGLGPERFLIASLSGSGLLARALSRLRRLYRALRGAR